MADRIYLDHAATTPMRPEAVAAVADGMARWANPSSPHAEGRAARAALEDARERIKASLGWEGELIFTSGASEALQIALGRAKVDRQLVSAVEHDAVFRAAPGAEVLPIGAEGTLDGDALAKVLARPGRAVVAVQHVNSEIGLMQPVTEIAEQVRASGGIMVSDCAQSAGKFSFPDADMIIVSAHKFGGPPGVGALFCTDLGMLEPIGGHEFGYRMGTENLPGALGFAAALDAADLQNGAYYWPDLFKNSEIDLDHAAFDFGGTLVTADGIISPYITAIAMPNMSAAAQLIRFDRMGFAVSAGSACSSGTLKQSRALAAFGVDEDTASRTIRLSFGWATTSAEIDAFREAWLEVAHDAKKRAA